MAVGRNGIWKRRAERERKPYGRRDSQGLGCIEDRIDAGFRSSHRALGEFVQSFENHPQASQGQTHLRVRSFVLAFSLFCAKVPA